MNWSKTNGCFCSVSGSLGIYKDSSALSNQNRHFSYRPVLHYDQYYIITAFIVTNIPSIHQFFIDDKIKMERKRCFLFFHLSFRPPCSYRFSPLINPIHTSFLFSLSSHLQIVCLFFLFILYFSIWSVSLSLSLFHPLPSFALFFSLYSLSLSFSLYSLPRLCSLSTLSISLSPSFFFLSLSLHCLLDWG